MTHPAPHCPARSGPLASTSSRFGFWAEGSTTTEIIAYFTEEDSDDALCSDDFEVPADSPISKMARQIAASPAATGTVAAILREAITACPCTPGTTTCPALDSISILEAMEQAAPVTTTPPSHGQGGTPA